jgi:hypothetical protein
MPLPGVNQVASNPWIIVETNDNPIFQGNMPHVQIEYVDYVNSAHVAEIQDRYGRTIAYLKGDTDMKTVRTGRMGWMYGVTVPTFTTDAFGNPIQNMASGRLIIYFE